MNARDDILTLVARLEKTEAVLQRLLQHYDEFLATDFELLGRKNTSAIVIAELLVDYYTCLETLFLRVSQFFENNIANERWHADLLEKMTLEIGGVRVAVISDETHAILAELMRFRHFRRYYFELEYDWQKLDYLQDKFAALRHRLPSELARFKAFLDDCLAGG